MTLTEQWKNKQLELHKSYYCQNKKGDICIATFMNDGALYSQELEGNLNFEYWEILEPVPSYKKWQKVLNIDFSNEVLRLENAKLKELLKECQHMIIAYSINNNTFKKEEVIDIVKQIDNAIGEK